MDKFTCWLPSWEELYGEIAEIVKKIREDKYLPDIVVALSRGGFVPARIICDMMIIKDLLSIKVDHWGITATKSGKAELRYPLNADLSEKRVLVVDDITDTGESMMVAAESMLKLNPEEVKTAAIFHIKTSKFVPDYFGREIEWIWVIWPWNYVEDMSNILPKVLDPKRSCSTEEVQTRLKKNFKISLSQQEVLDMLNELAAKKIVAKDRGGWRKRLAQKNSA